MMIRKKSNPWARAKYLYVLPLAAVTVAAFARPEISQPLDEISSVKVNDLSAVLETYADKNVSNPAEKDLQSKADSTTQKVVTPAASDNQPFDVVEQMPEFPGGMHASLEFMARNLKYPTQAQEAGKQGRVIVQFIVQKDGSLSDLHVLRAVDPWLDAEAIRVISIMPKWKPGMQDGKAVAIKYTMPVTFALEGSKNKPQTGKDDVVVMAYGTDSASPAETPTLQIHQTDNNGHTSLEKKEQSPMVLIDETEVSTETMNKLDPQQIESITVLKDMSATAKYGKKGKNGVILITTKKK